MISVIVPTSFILILQGAQPNYSGIIKFIFTPITSLTTIYIFLVKNMPGEVFTEYFFDKFGKIRSHNIRYVLELVALTTNIYIIYT